MNREWFRELWVYRELFYFLAWRDVKVRYKQTVLGVAWAILQPLLTMVIFLVLFAKIANISTEEVPPAIFYYTALVPWIYFSATLAMCGNSLVGNANLLTKVYFPRTILPGAVVLSGLVDFAIGALFITCLLFYYHIWPDWRLVLWPFLLLLLALVTLGLGMLLAALTVRYRDVKYAVPFLIQLGLFVTPVIYPPSMVPDQYHFLLALNPLSGIVDSFRSVFIPGRPIHWDLLGASIVLTPLIVAVGSVYFTKTEQSFADMV
jgi:lipopolysaccharide transport system permease protein